MQRASSDGYKAESIMIRVKIYENAITIDGHAKRDGNGDAACCAAVSAAVQTAAAFLERRGYDTGKILSPYEDHGGHFMLFTSAVKDKDRAIVTALIDILMAQAYAWPGEIEIERVDNEEN